MFQEYCIHWNTNILLFFAVKQVVSYDEINILGSSISKKNSTIQWQLFFVQEPFLY